MDLIMLVHQLRGDGFGDSVYVCARARAVYVYVYMHVHL